MSEMVERVALALRRSIESSPHNFGDVGIVRVYEDAARAVIEAMREPTEAMLEAVNSDAQPFWKVSAIGYVARHDRRGAEAMSQFCDIARLAQEIA